MNNEKGSVCGFVFDGNTDIEKNKIIYKIMEAIGEQKNVFVSCFAKQSEFWATELVLELEKCCSDIKLICALPYKGFEDTITGENKIIYNNAIQEAEEFLNISDEYHDEWYEECIEWITERSSVIIADNNITKQHKKFAQKNGAKIIKV